MANDILTGPTLALILLVGALPAAAAKPEGDQAKQAGNPAYAERQMQGKVIAVEPGATPPTITMRTQVGGHDFIVGADVRTGTIIREGKAVKKLTDVAPGDRVQLRWKRTDGGLVADQIRILPDTASRSM